MQPLSPCLKFPAEQVKLMETGGKGRQGERKTAAPGQTGQQSTPIPPSDSGGHGPHISQSAGWDCRQIIILLLVELNLLDPSPVLAKDYGLLLS